MPAFDQELRLKEQAEEMLSRRLSSIEEELKALRGAVERLVRVEERVTQALDTNRDLRRDLEGVYTRLRTLEGANGRQGQTLGWIERAFWAVVVVALTWYFSLKK